MFVGKVEHTITNDGRVSIPSKMRDVISKKYKPDDLYLVLMPENFICLYPNVEFESLASSLQNPDGSTLSSVMDTEREIFANAEHCKLDNSGRIVIPAEMRKNADIEQIVLVVGAGRRVELWNPKHWEWYQKQRGKEKLKVWPAQFGVK